MDVENRFEAKRQWSNSDRFMVLIGRVLKENDWSVEIEPRLGDAQPDFLLAKDGVRYVVEFKSSSDGKRARLLPLLSMAILQSQAESKSQPQLKPLAVIMAPRVEDSVAEQLRSFALAHAPDVAIGVIDFEGLRKFWGQGLENLNSEHPYEMREKVGRSEESAAHLFSDLNQWLLKVLIGQKLPPALIHVPRGEFRNASHLANAAGVSVMSAFRFLRQLEIEGFLNSSGYIVQIGNLEKLFQRWQAAIMMRPQKEISYRRIIRGASDEQLMNSIRAYIDINPSSDNRDDRPEVRMCVGEFLAASLLGFGHVSGVPPLIYSERIASDLPKKLGLARIEDSRPIDVFIRIPAFKESVFRAAVMRNGVPVSDIIQVWLECSINPARGEEQAMLIRSRVLNPLFRENP